MNKTLIYVLLCIVLIGSVSADVLLKQGLESNDVIVKEDVLQDKLVDTISLESAFKTDNIETIKDEIFTDLKSNDAKNKEAVFSLDTSKIPDNNLSMVFNEVCGKVKSYKVVYLKDNDYKVNADIQSALCSDGTYGYKVDWMPKLTIGENELINQKWAWWNQTFRLNNPNMYYVFINASTLNSSALSINNCNIAQLSNTEWVLFENISNDYQVSRARVMKTLFYGTNGSDGRVKSPYITGLTTLKTSYSLDVNKSGIYVDLISVHGVTSGIIASEVAGSFNETTNNNNVSLWFYAFNNVGNSIYNRAYVYFPSNTNIYATGSWSYNDDYFETDTSSWNKNNPTNFKFNISTSLGAGDNASIKGVILTKGNISFTTILPSMSTSSNYIFKNNGIPLFSYLDLSYFSVSFNIYNGTYQSINLTMSNGTVNYSFYSDTGLVYTNITHNDLSLWNISLTGGNYYTPTYLNYNVSTDLNIDRTITYSQSATSGVFGETSNIILNLTKGANQSYSNADLVYNGVVYASPTQTEYSDYTLFKQSVSNSAIGNFSYFWNVSLTDYGNDFNFTTVNSSHIVGGLSLNLSYFDTDLVSMSGKNVSLFLIGVSSGNYSTSSGAINISNLSSGDYTLLSSSSGYVRNSYVFSLTSLGLNPISLYLQLSNVTYYGLVTVKDKYSKDTISGATLTIQRYINNAWVTEQIYTTDFSGQAQGYFVIDSEFYNFLVSIGSTTYFGVINFNANKKVVYAQDITNGMIIEIDTQQGNSYYEFISSEYVSTSLNFTNTSNSTGYFTFRWIDANGNSRNGTLNVYVDNVLNCTNSAVSSSGIVTCSVSAGSPTYFLGTGWVDGVGINSYLAKLGVFNEFSLDWGAFGWIMSIFLVIIGYFAFSSIPSLSILVGTGIFALMSILNFVFKGINPLMFIGFLAVAFLIAKIPSRQGGNG